MIVYYVKSVEEYEALKAIIDKVVVVDFSAEWCKPCKAMAPLLEEMAKTYSDTVFVSVDIDVLGDHLLDATEVKSVPTFKLFLNSKLLFEFSGANEARLRSRIEAAQKLLP